MPGWNSFSWAFRLNSPLSLSSHHASLSLYYYLPPPATTSVLTYSLPACCTATTAPHFSPGGGEGREGHTPHTLFPSGLISLLSLTMSHLFSTLPTNIISRHHNGKHGNKHVFSLVWHCDWWSGDGDGGDTCRGRRGKGARRGSGRVGAWDWDRMLIRYHIMFLAGASRPLHSRVVGPLLSPYP